MTQPEYILKPDGKWFVRSTTETPLNIDDSILLKLSKECRREIRNLFLIPNWGPVSMNIGSACYLVMAPNRIHLRAPYRLLEKEKILVPVFSGQKSKDLNISTVWTIPNDMRLILLVKAIITSSDTYITKEVWLVALDKESRQWRLPLSNLYDNCILCLGKDAKSAIFPSLYDLMQKVVEWYERNPWNADLWDTVEQTQRMFRFKAEDKDFVQLPIDASHWTQLCKKVSLEVFENITL